MRKFAELRSQKSVPRLSVEVLSKTQLTVTPSQTLNCSSERMFIKGAPLFSVEPPSKEHLRNEKGEILLIKRVFL